MATVKKVEQRVRMGKIDIIKYQLLTYCFLKGIPIAEGELECLTLLATQGAQDLSKFCTIAHSKNIYASSQTVRNSLNKSEEKGLIIKDGKTRKSIVLNPIIPIQTEGNVLLDYKFIYVHEVPQV